MTSVIFALADEITHSTAPGSRIVHLKKVIESENLEVKLFSYNVYNSKKKPNFFPPSNLFEDIQKSYRLAKEVIRYSCVNNSIIISRGIYLSIFLSFFSFFKKVHYGIDFHCKMDTVSEWWFKKKLLHLLFFGPLYIFSILKSKFIIGITYPLTDFVQSFFKKKTFLIPNGVDYMSIHKKLDNNFISTKLSENKKYIFFIGHLEKWIPLKDFLDASTYPSNYEFVVIGQSREYINYSEKYKNVHFLGRLSHYETMNLAYKYADFFFHSYLINDIWKYKSSRKLLEYIVLNKKIFVNTKEYLPPAISLSKQIISYSNIGNFLSLIEKESSVFSKITDESLVSLSWRHQVSESKFMEYCNNY